MRRLTKGVLLATFASMLLMETGFVQAGEAANTKPVKCHGVNSCRGKGQCGSKGQNGCAGQNACKGKGWLYISSDECKMKGGRPD